MKKDETVQNYLESIYFINQKKSQVRAIDIVNFLHFSRPTVSVALKQLETQGYIKIENNIISLTNKGKKVAVSMSERHIYIANLLMKLGVKEDIAFRDSCLVEHDLSDQSFEAIKKATKKFVK